MTRKEAIEIMEEHVKTLRYQITIDGEKMMIEKGLLLNETKSKIIHRAYAKDQIIAYMYAIAAMKREQIAEELN